MIGRRGFITGLVSLVAAPAIVRVGSIMPVKSMIEPVYGRGPAMMARLNGLKFDRLAWAQHWEEVAQACLSPQSYEMWKSYR